MPDPDDHRKFSRQVARKARRKLRAQQENKRGVWYGFSMFGLVGWSVTVPTVMGALIGLWLDENHPAEFSWTLSCLVLGLLLGVYAAWFWVQKESQEIYRGYTEPDKGSGPGGEDEKDLKI